MLIAVAGCGGGTEADRIGVAAECGDAPDCTFEVQLTCLTQFKGGYCGLEGCATHAECPTGSACVDHTDGHSYCFRLCNDKADCNLNRTPANEANCSSNVTFAEPVPNNPYGKKACVPPSG